MKKVMILCLALATGYVGNSQDTEANNESSMKRWLHGFNFSVSQSNLIYDAPQASPPVAPEPQLSNSLGFGLGITSEFKASEHLSIRAYSGLAFNGGYFTYTITDNEEPLYQRDQHFLPVTLDAAIHSLLYLNKSGNSPYAILGVSGKLLLDTAEDSQDIPASGGFLSLDLGLGLNTAFTHFAICPELRYSYALQGMNHVRIPEQVFMHQVSLIIGLKG